MSRLARGVVRPFEVLFCMMSRWWLVVVETAVVLHLMKKMKAGLLPPTHPWVTGLEPRSSEPIWPQNIAYRSPSKRTDWSPEFDAQIVSSVGRFLCSMVKKSLPTPEIPQGPRRRMPHAVNYLHGAIHYNGTFAIFDDFADLVSHLSDPQFRRDLLAFGKREQREVTFVLRERDYDPLEYAFCVGAVRAFLPWFSNGNGPTKKPVLWGNASPWPAIALINGAWMADTYALLRGELEGIVRPPISPKPQFAASYRGVRSHFTWLDRFLAWVMFNDVRLRGFKGQLFFTDRRVIEPQRLEEYRKEGGFGRWVGCHPVPHPFRPLPSGKAGDVLRLSVIIPTLNEAEYLPRCLESVARFLHCAEVIVVDGGSRDSTREVAQRFGAKVLEAAPSRGGQCRVGAAHAKGEVLCFLHADTELTEGAEPRLRAFFSRTRNHVGTLRVIYPPTRRLNRIAGWGSRFDSYLTSTGDQGILVRRELYDSVGGIPDQPLFEDVEFFKRVRRHARVRSINVGLRVSMRRFEKRGMVGQLAFNAYLSALYAMGASPQELAQRYRATEKAG